MGLERCPCIFIDFLTLCAPSHTLPFCFQASTVHLLPTLPNISFQPHVLLSISLAWTHTPSLLHSYRKHCRLQSACERECGFCLSKLNVAHSVPSIFVYISLMCRLSKIRLCVHSFIIHPSADGCPRRFRPVVTGTAAAVTMEIQVFLW